jgi:nitrile hydratase accessory protein
MSMDRQTNHEIADMTGSGSLPRSNGELVFHDDWERRAFALAVALCEQGHYPWDQFRQNLIASIALQDETPENPDPNAPGYFEHWLAALEKTLADIGMISPA